VTGTGPLRILVTGGAGFIGSALIRDLIAAGDHVVLTLDSLTYAGHRDSLASVSANPSHRLERCDIADQAEVTRHIAAFRPSVIVHLAAETHVDRSIDGPGDFVRTNIVGTYSLLAAALGYWRGLGTAERHAFRFHHVSTDEVFGSLRATGRFDEESPYAPRSPYSASKAAADHLVRAWHHTYGLPVLVSTCSNNYGPYQHPEKLVPLTILKAIGGEMLPVYGTGLNVRDWLHVDDHVSALRAVFERGQVGETYAIGGDAERTNLDVVTAICSTLDDHRPRAGGAPHQDLIRFVADRPGHDFRYAIDAAKIRRELGWRPRETFESGIRRTVHWYLDNEAWWRRILAEGSGVRRLGLGPA
jgi:dTDP-glucose 4,6-dehydratase